MTGNAHTCNRTSTTPYSAAALLQEIYQECVGKGCWARLVRETRRGVETVTLSCREFHSPAKQRKRKPANEKRKARDRRRREAWVVCR